MSICDHYFINELVDNSIMEWLRLKTTEELIDDPIEAIKVSKSFPNCFDKYVEVYQKICGGHMIISPDIIIDFKNYPMINHFGNSWELLINYIQYDDKITYFETITHVYYNKFINHLERIFYLTRGYGRPNPFWSDKDIQIRNILMNSSLTGISILCPYFNLSSPLYVQEYLSGINLLKIPSNLINYIDKINQSFNPGYYLTVNTLKNISNFLDSINVPVKLSYDQFTDIIMTPLSYPSIIEYPHHFIKHDNIIYDLLNNQLPSNLPLNNCQFGYGILDNIIYYPILLYDVIDFFIKINCLLYIYPLTLVEAKNLNNDRIDNLINISIPVPCRYVYMRTFKCHQIHQIIYDYNLFNYPLMYLLIDTWIPISMTISKYYDLIYPKWFHLLVNTVTYYLMTSLVIS